MSDPDDLRIDPKRSRSRRSRTVSAGIGVKWTGDGRRPGHWRQTDVRAEGPIVRFLQAAFAENWRQQTGVMLAGDAYFPELEARGALTAQNVKSSPGGGSSEAYALFLLAIEGARQSIEISSPYFVPDHEISEALARARRHAAREDRCHRRPLGRRRQRQSRPALLRAEPRGSLIVYDASVARRLEEIYGEDLRFAKEVTREDWKRRGLGHVLELFVLPIRNQL